MSPDVASKRGVTCPCGVKEPGGVAKCGVKMWRHASTWRQGARWRRQMWRQNVASLTASGSPVASPDVASGGQVASPDVASERGIIDPRGVRGPGGVARCGVKTWRHLSGGQVASPDVASKMWCPRGVRQPRGIVGAVPGFTPMASPGIAGHGVKSLMWRSESHVASPDWRQNVASGAIDLRGVAGRGVERARQVSSKRVFSRRAICAPPHPCLQSGRPTRAQNDLLRRNTGPNRSRDMSKAE